MGRKESIQTKALVQTQIRHSFSDWGQDCLLIYQKEYLLQTE